MKHIFLFSTLFCLINSCKNERIAYKIKINSKTQFLGHKGSGIIGVLGNINLLENTKKSILNSIDKIDGSEFDLQLSADKTLWIFHDYDIIDCKGIKHDISLISDSLIQEISKCNYSNQLITFQEFMNTINDLNLPPKTFVLDLKVLQDNNALNLFRNGEDFYSFLSNSIIASLPKKSKINIIAEVYQYDQYIFFKTKAKIKTFQVIHEMGPDFKIKSEASDFSIPIENNFHLLLKNKSFGVWTANNVDQMIKALSYNPKYILSDNIPLSLFFRELKKKKAHSEVLENKEQKIYGKNDFHTIKILNLNELDEDFILNFFTKNVKNKLALTFSSIDKNGKCIYWNSYPISSRHSIQEFIDVDFLKKLGGKELTVNILNLSKSYFELDGFVLKKIFID